MKHFTIENNTNNITIHSSAKEAELVPDSERFNNEAALANLAANWPTARLVEIWNSLPGATEVKKFTDRATAVSRIWKAIQTLGQAEPVNAEANTAPVLAQALAVPETAGPEAAIPETTDSAPDSTVAPQSPDVASDAAPARTKATRAKKAPKTAMGLGTPREGSKTSKVIAMLKGEGGVTLEEIMAAMGWLKHTTRAMLSAGGSLTKKHGLVIVSEKVGDKRTYRIAGWRKQRRESQAGPWKGIGFFRCMKAPRIFLRSRPKGVINGYARGRSTMAATDFTEITTPGFAIELLPDTNLGSAMLIVEDEEGHYEPAGIVRTISEGKEIVENDMRDAGIAWSAEKILAFALTNTSFGRGACGEPITLRQPGT